MPTRILPTPGALVENGAIHTGFFKTPFRRANLLDATNFGGRLARPLRWLRLKEWVGFGITHQGLYGGILIQNAKFAATGAIYLYDRETRQKHGWSLVDLPPRVHLPETLWDSRSTCARGGEHMMFVHKLDEGFHRIDASFRAHGPTPALSVALELGQDLHTVDPLVVSLPIGAKHHTYTHKSPLRLSGTIRIGDREYLFDPGRDLGNLDEQKTFYPYRSHWWWGCFGTYSSEGRQVMLNFVDQMTPKNEQGEDALWIDGKLELIAQPQIIPDGTSYRIEDRDGRLRLRFTTAGAKAEKRNFGVAAMDYEQFYGSYAGVVVDQEGHSHAIANAFGALERMVARF